MQKKAVKLKAFGRTPRLNLLIFEIAELGFARRAGAEGPGRAESMDFYGPGPEPQTLPDEVSA